MTDDINKSDDAKALQQALAISEAIRDLGRVPSGHLFARVMGHMSLSNYNRIIDTLKAAGLVEEQNFELIWIGPKLEGK